MTGITENEITTILTPSVQDFSFDFIIFLAIGLAGMFFILKIGVFKLFRNIF